MKIKRRELNRLVENYFQKPQLLTELLNIQRTLNKINPYFENPDARGEKYRVNAEELQALQDTDELAGIIKYFRDKQAKIKRDVEKMRPGRKGRYNELEEKIKALEAEMERLNIPVPDSAPEPPPEITTPEPEGDTEPQPGPSGDPYEYKVDKEGEYGNKGCWVTRKKGTSTWKKIKGNEKIGGNWKAIFQRLDAKIGGRTNLDIENCSGPEAEPPAPDEINPRPSGPCDTMVKSEYFGTLRQELFLMSRILVKYNSSEKLKSKLPQNVLSAGNKIQRFFDADEKDSYTQKVAELLRRMKDLKAHCEDKKELEDVDFVVNRIKTLCQEVGSNAIMDELEEYAKTMKDEELGQKGVAVGAEAQMLLAEPANPSTMSESSTFRRWAKNAKLL